MPGPVQFSPAFGRQGAPPLGAKNADEINEHLDENAPEPVVRSAPAAVVKKAPKVTTKNVVQLAKARLKEVRAELRRMKALEKERDELERLVAAAENKPRAVVREIKRSAG